MLEGKIVTLFEDEEKTKPILPRTTLSAVTGKNGLNIQGELDKKQDTLTAGDNITIENNVIDTKEDYLPLTGGTLTGSVTAPSFQTGTNESAYFQTKKMRGEGNANTYYHAVDWGYQSHNQVDFHEYGGTWNFYQNKGGKAGNGNLVGSIQPTGWNGGAVLTGTPTAPTAAEGTNTTQIATTEFVTNAVAKKDLSKYRTSADQDTIDNAIKDRITTIENKESTWDSKADTSYVDTEVAKKQDTLVSGTNIKTLNSESLLGSGDIVLTKSSIGLSDVDNTSDANKPISTATQTALDKKQDTISDLATIRSGASKGATAIQSVKTINSTSLIGTGDITIDKSTLGLSNVDNTSDADKPISTATQTALDSKQSTLVSGTNIKTVNGDSLLGSGDLEISGLPEGGTEGQILTKNSDTAGDVTWTDQPIYVSDGVTASATINADLLQGHDSSYFQQKLVSGTNIATVNGQSLLQATDILSNVDNTADLDKPISTLTQNALDGKQDTLLINFSSTNIALHRIPRGKDITSYYNDGTLWTRIANNFDDIYVGDYFKMSRAISAYERTGSYQATGSQYVTISELNPELYNGDSQKVGFNHIELIPGQFMSGSFHFGRSRMNSSNTTTGGYVGSEMFTTTLGAVTSSGSTASTASINQQLYAEFGTHLKTFRALLSNGINSTGYNRFGTNGGCANGWTWADVQSVLLSEMDVYGGTIWSSSGYDSGTSKTQKSLFKYCPECINNRSSYYWLKDVASSASFAAVSNVGDAYCTDASYAAIFVRPRFIVA